MTANQRTKIYISGKITGDPNYKEKFLGATKRVLEDYPGCGVINPAELPDLGSWEKCMRNDITYLVQCDFIYMLTDWNDSKGAVLEHFIAHQLGIEIIYEVKP